MAKDSRIPVICIQASAAYRIPSVSPTMTPLLCGPPGIVLFRARPIVTAAIDVDAFAPTARRKILLKCLRLSRT